MSDYFDFVNEPITYLRKSIFKKLISKIKFGTILDLGCGSVGHYWSLGYINEVENVSFVDYNNNNIIELESIITNLDPTLIESNFGDTIYFLLQNNIIKPSSNHESIAVDIVSKVNNLQVYDFLNEPMDVKFDYILTLESIECVQSEKEFILALNNIAAMLQPEGKLLCHTLRYQNKTDYTKQMIIDKMEGEFNPSISQLQQCFDNSNLKLEWIESTNSFDHSGVAKDINHNEAIFLEASLR